MNNISFCNTKSRDLLKISIEVLEETNIDINANKSGVEFQTELPIKFKSK